MLKITRIEKCLSQEELAVLSKVSIKTIQRIENGKSKGSAYSIKQLSAALNIDPICLQNKDYRQNHDEQNTQSIIKLINWSALAVIVIPFTNIILPLIILHKNKNNNIVSQMGKKIVSVQILWTFISLALMISLPLFFKLWMDQTYAGSVPMFIPVYLVAVLINITIILTIAFQLSNKKADRFWLPNLL